MSLSQTVNYDNASNFTFDSSKIEFVSSTARLKLGFSAITPFSEDFTDDTDFTYDNTKAEFTGGVVQGKDQSAANSQFATKLATKDLIWRKDGGSVTGTLNGTPTFGSGEMVCTGTQGVYYTYNTAVRESHKFLYRPNHSGAPPANVNLLSIENGTNNNDRFNLTHSPSGTNLRLTLYNNVGGVVISVATAVAGFSPTASQQYEFEVVLDSVAGTVRVFVDGTLVGTSSPGAWTRGTSASRVYLGAAPAIYNRSEGDFDNYIYFNNAQHTSTYVPGYSIVDLLYLENIVTLPTFTYVGPGNLAPSGPPSSTESGSPRYIIQGKYWDGAAWSDSSDTYATATSKADILANIGTFPDTGSSTIIVKVAFPDANTNSNVDQIDFTVAGELYPTDTPTVVSNSFLQLDGLESFVESVSKTGSDDVKYLIARYATSGGTPTYYRWNGAAWETTTLTFANSNTASEINTNAATLPVSDGYFFRVFVFLSSDDGTTTPSITSHTVTYDFFVEPATPSKCIIYGWLREVDNTPLAGTVTVRNTQSFYHSGLLIPRSEITVTADSEGYWEVELIETASVGRTYDFITDYTDPSARTVRNQFVTVPNQDSAALEDLI